ncbi:hypothetical protein IFVP408_C140073 [Vibrio parahaemolyticus]
MSLKMGFQPLCCNGSGATEKILFYIRKREKVVALERELSRTANILIVNLVYSALSPFLIIILI